MKARVGPSTLSVHAGERDGDHDSVVPGPLEPPLVLSSAYALGSAEQGAAAFRGETDAHVYTRWGNPSVEELERRVAALEGAEDAVAAGSGMAAVSAVLLSLLSSGDHVVAPVACYGETSRLLRERLPRLGITTSFVDATQVSAIEAAITATTRVLYVETPANPNLAITDLSAVAVLAKARGLVLVADNTFATPFCQRPLELGADVVLHSLTKALCGHGDAVGGLACGSGERMRAVRDVVKGFGGVLSPFNAFLVSRGVRTLALRQGRACDSALALAQRLSAHRAVRRVLYPGLSSHPGHDAAAAQMSAFGALLSFDVESLDRGREILDRVRLITHAVSLGDARSLITHPASTTAANVPPDVRAAAGIGDGLLRLSVGIEDVDDLWDDLERALG